MPGRLRRRHPREEEHGTAEGLPFYKETYYHKIMNEKSQTIYGRHMYALG